MSNHRFDEEAFARMLEGAQAPHSIDAQRMRALVQALERARPAQTGPSPMFASALRERLAEEAGVVAEAQAAARVSIATRAAIWLQAKNEAWRRSFRVVAATGMAAMMLAGTSAAFATAQNALPGQWNYSLKRAGEAARMSVTRGDLPRGYAKLDIARERLDEVRALAASGNRDAAIYVAVLGDMDAATIDASELLVEASREGAGLTPLRRLASFTTAQRLRLEGLVVDVPPGARPAARDSLATLVLLGDRVQNVIEGCPCPGNPLEVVTSSGTQTSGLPCSCESGTSGRPGSSDQPQAVDDPQPQPSGSGSPSPEPSTGTDLVPGTDADDPANGAVDQVNDILDGLGLPTVSPSPLPLPSPSISL